MITNQIYYCVTTNAFASNSPSKDPVDDLMNAIWFGKTNLYITNISGEWFDASNHYITNLAAVTNSYTFNIRHINHWWQHPVDAGWLFAAAIAGMILAYLALAVIRNRW